MPEFLATQYEVTLLCSASWFNGLSILPGYPKTYNFFGFWMPFWFFLQHIYSNGKQFCLEDYAMLTLTVNLRLGLPISVPTPSFLILICLLFHTERSVWHSCSFLYFTARSNGSQSFTSPSDFELIINSSYRCPCLIISK